MAPIIQSLLDTDLYKFTMLQVVLHKFPQTHSVYHFRCRNLEETVYPLTDILDDLNHQLDLLCQLKFKEDELQYLRGLRFIKSDFVDYLELFQLKRRFIQASIDSQGRLDIIVEGPMVQAMMFEIFVLAIVNELYFSRIRSPEVLAEGERRLTAKIELLKQCDAAQDPNDPPFLVSDFGTRRRYSFVWQKHVVEEFNKAAPHVFRGTSNVLLAKELGITPIGTMAHEFLQAFQAL
ncbi:MAG TPA: nicotinate phosphoribosyltransferase, partial [Acinetobacter lwoffii]|nr:nicotinate phosphoribosyltransferase [Acinetobacter lwoffii]